MLYTVKDVLGDSNDVIYNVPESDVESAIYDLLPKAEIIPGACEIIHDWKNKDAELISYLGIQVI